METVTTSNEVATELLTLAIDSKWSVHLNIGWQLYAGLTILIFIILLIRRQLTGSWLTKNYEIDEAEIGLSNNKIKFKPNIIDRQVAYSIWVELSTRKIGLPIDFEHDVIAEVYDSWYSFFSITRDLVKSIPVSKVRQSSTEKIIKLSIEVLNHGLRPHLTKWHARFRRWYEYELNNTPAGVVIDPQEIQKNFPKWQELKVEMEQVNANLIAYRNAMKLLVMSS